MRSRGWRVFAACRKQEDCDRLLDEGFDSPRIDYQDGASILAGVEEVMAATGGTLEALFNNGAYALPGAVEDLPTDGLREVFEANFFGWHTLTRAVIPVMRAQGKGRIVQCSSVLGFVPMPWRGAYIATKHALDGLTNVLRIEMRDTPVRVVTIEPGPIATSIRANSIPHFERWIDWRSSPRAAQYERTLLKRLYEGGGSDLFERQPSAVTDQLIKALEAANPRPRYRVTHATRLMSLARRTLSTRMLDRLTARG